MHYRRSDQNEAETTVPALQVTIVYDDLDSGQRGREFTERLADALGCDCDLSDSMWRSDLLTPGPIAADATRSAIGTEYFVISLRGDRPLPQDTHQWIARQLDGAGQRGTGVIVLSGSGAGEWRLIEEIRFAFRRLCAEFGAAFFAHTVTPCVESVTSEVRSTWSSTGPVLATTA